MAIQMSVYSKSQRQEAERLAAMADKWAEGFDRQTGVRFNLFTSKSTPGAIYRTRIDGRGGCTCPGARHSRTGGCVHQLACAIVTERAQQTAEAPVSLSDLRVMLPGCVGGCGNVIEQGGLLWCDECSATRERSQRLAAARARVLAEVMG